MPHKQPEQAVIEHHLETHEDSVAGKTVLLMKGEGLEKMDFSKARLPLQETFIDTCIDTCIDTNVDILPQPCLTKFTMH